MVTVIVNYYMVMLALSAGCILGFYLCSVFHKDQVKFAEAEVESMKNKMASAERQVVTKILGELKPVIAEIRDTRLRELLNEKFTEFAERSGTRVH